MNNRFSSFKIYISFGIPLPINIRIVLSHREPFDAQLAAKWKIALWGENERRHTFKICQLHFAENDLIRSVNGIRLKLGAVPCLLIDSVASDVDSRGRVEFECYDYDNKIDDNVDCMQVESVFVEAEPMHES